MKLKRPLVLCGPSGSGKSTLLKLLMTEFGDCFGFSVSHTTRKPRPGEIDGKDYYFVDVETMEKGIKSGEFIEFTKFSGNYYGTSKNAIKKIQEEGKICILDIEIEGVKNIKKTNLNANFVFIKPPSLDILEERLRNRGTDSEESIIQRLRKAKEEIQFGETEGNFGIVIVNSDINKAYNKLKQFLLQDLEIQ